MADEYNFCSTTLFFHTDTRIYVQNTDGTNARKLLDLADYNTWKHISDVEWSIDGKKFAFAAVRKDIRVVDLIVVDADLSNAVLVQTLVGTQYATITDISWKPDNQYLFFVLAFFGNKTP